jgi:hypothetical protein
MKYPTNRTIIYTIVRTQSEIINDRHDGWLTNWVNPVVLDSFRTLERAEEVVGQFEQQFKEAGVEDFYMFEIQTSSFYDE